MTDGNTPRDNEMTDSNTPPWWAARLDQGTTMVYLKFPPGGCGEEEPMIPLQVSKLEMICKHLPIFDALLFGHPRMAPSSFNKYMGFPVLMMPTTVSSTAYPEGTKLTKVFHGLVDILLLEAPDVRPNNMHSEMMCLADQLGGSVRIDAFKKSIQQQKMLPMTPNEDTKAEYLWRLSLSLDDLDLSKQRECQTEGYQISKLYCDDLKRNVIAYRKRKFAE